ncbi:phage capsid protein [Cellulophaga phage phi39:1]|uniref:phage capsid protein n=1 Tax=Cellulophaga phage phi39:1 TaxID=1327993 RepID=UPI000351B493|nr:phage capsid protein [Cellulophaga phage phi39:1]AGO49127.1 phage capsid protein [Cellulophaga phage phi39:1]
MRKVQLIRAELQTKIDAQKAIADTAKADEKRSLTVEETENFDAIQEEIVALRSELERAIAYEDNQRAAAAARAIPVPGGDPGDGGEGKEREKLEKRFSLVKALRSANPIYGQKLDGAELEMHQIGQEENRAAKINVEDNVRLSLPVSYLARATAQTVSEDSGAFGGALVTSAAPQMVESLKPKLFLEELGANFMSGLSGGDVPLVVDADFTMAFMAETATATIQKKAYAGATLNPKRAAGAVDISNRLLMQSSVAVDQRIQNSLMNGFKKVLQSSAINGAGGVAPTGLLNLSGVNVGSSTGAVDATWNLIVELMALIEEDDATENSLGWLMHPKLKAALKTIKKDAGSGRFLMEGSDIDAVKAISTSLIPTLVDDTTDVFPLIYGDWSQMAIGQWGSINLSVNPYSADLSNSLRVVMNVHADVAVANPKAFAKNSFLKG